MPEPSLLFTVTCPDCALESITKLSIAVIANGLLTGMTLRLHSNCHDCYWNATFIEREKLRKALALLGNNSHSQNQPHSEELAFAD
jgi:hypothetical protein